MKTSNKLISVGILILAIGLTSFLIAAKSAMVDKVDRVENDTIDELELLKREGGDKIIERNLGKLLASNLDLEGNHRYILDPTSEEVIVIGKSKYINDFEMLTDSTLFDATIYYEVSTERDFRNNSKTFNIITDTLFYKIGVKGKRDLLLMIGNESKVTASELLELSSLMIVMDGTSHIDASLNCNILELNTRNQSHARLKGVAQSVSITSYDNSNLECGELSSQQVDIVLSDNSRVGLRATDDLNGVIRNNAYYNNYGFVNGSKVLVKDNARFD